MRLLSLLLIISLGLVAVWLSLVSRYTAQSASSSPRRLFDSSLHALRKLQPEIVSCRTAESQDTDDSSVSKDGPGPALGQAGVTSSKDGLVAALEQVRASAHATGHRHFGSITDELIHELRAGPSTSVADVIRLVLERRQHDAKMREALQAALDAMDGVTRASADDTAEGGGDGVMLPRTSTVRCLPEVDGTDLCIYTNVCVDVAGPNTDGLKPVYLLVAPPPAVAEYQTMRANGTLRGHMRHWGDGPMRTAPQPRTEGGDGGPPAGDLLHRARHSIARLDDTFMDVNFPLSVFAHRLLPLHGGGDVDLIPPSDTVSMTHGGGWGEGGSFPGSVTWVDSFYSATAMLGEHMWGCASSVMYPVLAAYWANVTRSGGLPPLDHLVVTAHDGSTPAFANHGTAWEMSGKGERGAAGRWCRVFLEAALKWVRGGAAPFNGKEPLGVRDAAYPVLDALAHAFARGADNASSSSPSAGIGAPCDPIPLPYDVPLLASTGAGQGGTRVTWNFNDVPLPPQALPRNCGGRANATPRPPPTGFSPATRRVCARSGVLLGRKPLLLGGYADTSAFRVFANSALGLPATGHADKANYYARPLRALIVDRGRNPDGSLRARGFANLDGMTALLDKYGVPYDVLTDEAVGGLGLVEQARAYATHGLIVTGHGAAENNLVFAPARAVVIEVSPFGQWCPMYTKLASTMGLHVFSLHSLVKGPGLSYNYTLRRAGEEAVQRAAAACDGNPLPARQMSTCAVEYKVGAIMTPLAQFEATLVHALELLGRRTYPNASLVHLLDGVPDGGPGPYKWSPGMHEELARQGRAKVCDALQCGTVQRTYPRPSEV